MTGLLKESQEALAESHGASAEIELLLAQSLTAVGRHEDAAQTLREETPKDAGAATGGWTVWRETERSGATKVARQGGNPAAAFASRSQNSIFAFIFYLRFSGDQRSENLKDGWLKSSQFYQLSAAPQLQPSDSISYGRANSLM